MAGEIVDGKKVGGGDEGEKGREEREKRGGG